MLEILEHVFKNSHILNIFSILNLLQPYRCRHYIPTKHCGIPTNPHGATTGRQISTSLTFMEHVLQPFVWRIILIGNTGLGIKFFF